jgi:hypothetical protein
MHPTQVELLKFMRNEQDMGSFFTKFGEGKFLVENENP